MCKKNTGNEFLLSCIFGAGGGVLADTKASSARKEFVRNKKLRMLASSHEPPTIRGFSYPLSQKKRTGSTRPFLLAQREGFEPPETLVSTVFKTAAIDHSTISAYI